MMSLENSSTVEPNTAEQRLLHLPSPFIAKHRSKFKNGVVWHAWARADAKLSKRARHVRYCVREYRDAYREAFGLLGNTVLLDYCSSAVSAVRVLVEGRTALEAVGLAADKAARLTIAAIKQDPVGAPDLTDVLEGLADTLTERPDTQFCGPHVLIALAPRLAMDGELEVAVELLDSTIVVLNKALKAGTSCILVAQYLALALCAKADLHEMAGEPEARLLAVRRAWQQVQSANATYRHFVIPRYRKVLEDQHHPDEVIQAARLLERQLAAEVAGNPVDWVLESI
jgi:hypothetical protein